MNEERSPENIVTDESNANRQTNENGGSNRGTALRESLLALIPGRHMVITPILIDLNLLVFLLMVLSGAGVFQPDSESLLKWGANYTPLTLDMQYWRLLTCTFIHIGIFHLLLNMYALLNIGLLLEPLLGKTRFLVAYLLTGLTASMTSLWWHDVTLSAGASGAIFGMYGFFLAMLTTNYIEKTARKELLSSIGLFVGYNLLFGLNQGIDNSAHIGGLISGLLIGYAFTFGLKNRHNVQLNRMILIGVSLIVLTVLAIVYVKLPNGLLEYDKKTAAFSENEHNAIAVFQQSDSLPVPVLLTNIQNAEDLWKKNIQLMDEAKALKLPVEISASADKLKKYAELRLKFTELYYKTINENTNKYATELEQYNKEIEELLKDINAENKKE
ncbi:MAG: rhomboid family intramembrane serine protease [Bacteroidia bacterium]